MIAYLLTAVALVNYLLFSWFLGGLLKLKSPDIWIFRGGLAIIGIGAAGLFLWYWIKRQREKKLASPEGAAAGGDELDSLLNEAEAKLASSRLQQGASFGALPVIFMVGPAGSTKTSSMVHSGLDPDHLAGQIYQDTTIVPTRTANLWFAHKTVFVEASGRLTGDATAWSRLIRRMRPHRLGSVFGKAREAPRAAVVCLPCDIFLKPGAAENVAGAARTFAARLGEVSQLLGINIPVYVLFTKLDRLSFFHEFAQNLNEQEHSQVLGVTLPGGPQQTTGVYAQRESARLAAEFDQLFYSLAEKRTMLLSRESGTERPPGIYEFPREFRKLRSLMTDFLVDLCRPSQLSCGPFLRGFYFCGVRPVVVKDVVAAVVSRPSASQQARPKGDATGIFQMEQMESNPTPQALSPSATARKVPQWVFLNHFFASVLLTDGAGLGASGSSVKTNTLRRILYASAAGVCLLLCLALTISFFGNRGLVSEARDAANGITVADANASGPALTDALNRLETLRRSLETLTRYEREGAPLHLKWGLYAGSDIYPQVKRLYFERFNRLLFRSTQGSLAAKLNGLPNAPSPTDDCGYPYDTLKAYLMTTSHWDKATKPFLSPLLKSRWAAGRTTDPEQMNLAQKQFDFYSDELPIKNPFSTSEDASVEKAQSYVSLCAGSDRVYQIMLSDANNRNPPVNFNRTFAGSAEVVVNNLDMAGAYTKPGWAFMQNAIKNAQSFAARDEWVLGRYARARGETGKLEQDLKAQYYSDFVKQWREYLKKTAVVRYVDFKDAAKKLSKTASSQSPLLSMFWLASQHTGVDPEVVKAFKPLHAVVSAGADQPSGPTNKDYINALGKLQLALENAAGQPPENEQAVEQVRSSANEANLVAGQMPLGLDQEAHLEETVLKLLKDPIIGALGTIRPPGPPGKALCTEFRPLFSKYPFNPNSPSKATMEEIADFFAPGKGKMWVFYDASLKKVMTPQGVPIPGATPAPTAAFAQFFRRAAAFANALYPGGSATPKLTFSMRPVMAADVQSVRLEIEGQSIVFSGSSAGARQFAWPGGTAHGVRLTGNWVDGSNDYPFYDGIWGIIEFFSDADTQPSGAGTTFGWILKGGRQGRPVTSPSTGQVRQVRFDLDMSPNVFQKGYFPSMNCPG